MKDQKHGLIYCFWGLALAFVVGALLIIGGLKAIQTAMIIGALPFSLVIALMAASLVRAIIRDGLRARALQEA